MKPRCAATPRQRREPSSNAETRRILSPPAFGRRDEVMLLIDCTPELDTDQLCPDMLTATSSERRKIGWGKVDVLGNMGTLNGKKLHRWSV